MKRKIGSKILIYALTIVMVISVGGAVFAAESNIEENSSSELISHVESITTSGIESEGEITSQEVTTSIASSEAALPNDISSELESTSEEQSSISSEIPTEKAEPLEFSENTTVVDVSTATMPFRILSGSTENYEFTGSYSGKSHGVIIEAGYNGTIILNNLQIDVSAAKSGAMFLLGNNSTEITPLVSDIDIVLKGENRLISAENWAGLEVRAGTQITISADESDPEASLTAQCVNVTDYMSGSVFFDSGGSGIGAGKSTIGGNIIIKSGKVTGIASYHGAGIGGGWLEGYNGNIVIYGGDVTSIGGSHGAGIGGGCYNTGKHLEGSEDFQSTGVIMVLPPTKITAVNSGSDELIGNMGTIVYVGDVSAPLVDARTSENTKNIDIFMDLSNVEGAQKALAETGISNSEINIGKILVGNTGESAQALLNMRLSTQNPVKFYTEAVASDGRAFSSESAVIIADSNIVLTPFGARNYSINYHLNGGNNDVTNPVRYTEGIGVEKFAPAYKEGYTFNGWYSDEEYQNLVTSIDALKIGEVNLYASFTENVTYTPPVNVAEAPKTGDENDVLAWSILAGAAMISLIAVTAYTGEGKKRKDISE